MELNANRSGLQMTLGPRGEVASIRHRGRELCVPAAEAFTLELLDRSGDALTLKSSEFAFDGAAYSDHPAVPGLTVTLTVSVDDEGSAFRFRPRVTGIPKSLVLSWFDGPQLVYPMHREFRLLLPLHDGVVVDDPVRKGNRAYHPIGFAKRGKPYGSAFPGRAQFQFMAFYRENEGGVYFAAHDPHCATKAVEYDPGEEGVRLSLQTFTGCGFGEDYTPDWDYVVRGFDGSWQGAAELYRNWHESVFRPRADFPRWMEQSPFVMIYPVRGHGLDTGDMTPNCYYPYSRALPVVRRFRNELQAPVMALLMHWEGTAPWAPPYVWPPFGGEAMLAEFRDALHREGNLLGVYCSGTAWTCTSSILPEYAPGCTPEQEKMMLRGPKGELGATVCNGVNSQRLGYDLCLAEPPARKIVTEEILKLADFDIDYAQFFDQNHGGGVHNCFARDHHHPPVPGAWQTAMQADFMRGIAETLRRRGKTMLLGCESAAAEPFAEFLALNDARAPFAGWIGDPVPLQQFILHGVTANFTGNQCGSRWSCDFARSPYSLNRRLAYGFHAGDLLSATLREEGDAHWCWALPWSEPGPAQGMLLELLRNLTRMRQAHPEYLLYGRMLPDAVPVSGETLEEFDPEGRAKPFPAFYHTTWEAPEGRRAVIAVNYLDREQQLRIDGDAATLPGCSVKLFPLN